MVVPLVVTLFSSEHVPSQEALLADKRGVAPAAHVLLSTGPPAPQTRLCSVPVAWLYFEGSFALSGQPHTSLTLSCTLDDLSMSLNC